MQTEKKMGAGLMETSWHKRENVLLLIIIAFSFSLRIYGINMKIPHPDAYVFIEGAMYYGLTDIPPASENGFYALYVAPVFALVDLLIVLYALFFIVGWLQGIFPDLNNFGSFYHTNMDYFYVLARIGTISIGIGSIIAVYFIAKKVFDYKTGLLSALFLGVSFMHSMHSQFVRMDIIAIFFILLSVFYSLAIFEKGDLRFYILAGVFAGSAIASKYTSGLAIFPIFTAHLLIKRRDFIPSAIKTNLFFIPLLILGLALSIAGIWGDASQISNLVAGYISPDGVLNENSLRFLEIVYSKLTFLGSGFILTALVVKWLRPLNFIAISLMDKRFMISMLAVFFSFIIVNPIFLFNLDKIAAIFLADPNFLGGDNFLIGVDRLEGIKTHLWYLTNLGWALGTHIAVLGGFGLIMAIFRRRGTELVLLTFPILYFLIIGMGNLKWERYLIPLLPFVTIYAGKFLVDCVNRISQLKHCFFRQREGMVLTALSIVLIVNPTYNILRYDYLLTRPDTRTLSEQWARNNMPLKAKIGQDYYTGELPDDMFDITKKYSISLGKSFADYKSEGLQYMIVSSTMYERIFAEPQRYSKNIEFYQQLFREGELIKEFKPDADLWPPPDERFSKYHIHVSPTIKVYKIQ